MSKEIFLRGHGKSAKDPVTGKTTWIPRKVTNIISGTQSTGKLGSLKYSTSIDKVWKTKTQPKYGGPVSKRGTQTGLKKYKPI